MNKDLLNKVGSVGQDNLFAKLFPPAEPFGVKIAAGQGVLERGTVLALTDSGAYIVAGSAFTRTIPPANEGGTATTEDVTPLANCVLADPVDASGSSDVTAVAYRVGHFNSKALIWAKDYTPTINDKEELRKGGILLSEMMD